MESSENRNESQTQAQGVVIPTPTFNDTFRSYFAHPGRWENGRKNMVLYSNFLKILKNKPKLVMVNGEALYTLSIADAHEELKVTLGKDIILYPDLHFSKCPELRILRADYTERQDKLCAMMLAAFSGDYRGVKKLIYLGSYVDRQMPNGNTPLMEAVAGGTSGRCKCIELLLGAGARINIENEQGHTVFTSAAWAGDMKVIRLLYRMRTVNINHQTKRGSTALTLAIIQQHHDIVRFLVTECGANPLIEDRRCMTAVCWSQISCPSATGYLCLHLGFKNQLDTFVMRRVEVLKALALLCARDAEDPDVFEMPRDEAELFNLLYNLTNILLLLKPSRRTLITKGVLNLVGKKEMWEDLLPEDDHDSIDVALLQILPWFIALGCGMLYNETYILEGFIKTGAADRFVDTMNRALPVADGIRGRLSIQAMLSPLMAFKQGRQWLCRTGFKYKHVLEHFVDTENLLEERGTDICKAFIQLMDANFGHYKLKDNYKIFGEAEVKKLCPEPAMSVREKLQETLAHFEEIKQQAKEAQADLNMQEFLNAERREFLMRQERDVKSKMRKLKKKERRKMQRLQDEVAANKEEETEKCNNENSSEGSIQKTKNAENKAHHQPLRRTFEDYLYINQERPIAMRSAEDMYCYKVESKKNVEKSNNEKSRERMILSFLIENAAAGGEWKSVPKRKAKKGKKPIEENEKEKQLEAEREKAIALTEKVQERLDKTCANKATNVQNANTKTVKELKREQKPAAPRCNKPPRLMDLGLKQQMSSAKNHKVTKAQTVSYSAACIGEQDTKAAPTPQSPRQNPIHRGPPQPVISLSDMPGALLLSQVEQNILKKEENNAAKLEKTPAPKPEFIFGFFGDETTPAPTIQGNSAGTPPTQPIFETASKPKSEPSSVANPESDVAPFPTNPAPVSEPAPVDPIEAGAAGDQAPKAVATPELPKMTWVPRSLRWRPFFERLIATPPNKRQKVGSIHLSFYDEALIIAAGSNGTLVSIGLRDDGMEVAVKRLPKCNSRFIKNELENLRIPEIEHENIVKYRDYVEDENFGYLALELCECTLEDYVHELKHTGQLQERARRLVWQLLRGLAVLHRAKILHMDLKPRNVLVDVRGNVRLADFGLSRRMDEAHSTDYHAAFLGGTRCWRPREALLSVGSEDHPEPYMTVSDVQVAGMVIYYVMSGGQHPYGQSPADIEEAIVSGVPRLSDVTDETLVNLMSWMLHPDVHRRKSAEECLTHPFFWQETKRFAFLYKVSQEAEFQLHTGRTSQVRQVIDSMGAWLKMGDWRTEVDPYVMSPQMSLLSYSSSMSDLLRFMADVENDFNKIDPKLRSMLGDPGFYFLIKFPRVFMVVYEIIRESDLRHRRSLTDFFDVHNYVENN